MPRARGRYNAKKCRRRYDLSRSPLNPARAHNRHHHRRLAPFAAPFHSGFPAPIEIHLSGKWSRSSPSQEYRNVSAHGNIIGAVQRLGPDGCHHLRPVDQGEPCAGWKPSRTGRGCDKRTVRACMRACACACPAGACVSGDSGAHGQHKMVVVQGRGVRPTVGAQSQQKGG